MGKKHKLLETDAMRDRFTALPDEVAVHILSSLDLRDLTRVGAVSKRFYEFYLLTPSFGFQKCNDNMKIKSDKMNCFDQFLRRRGNNKMHRFAIDLCLPKGLSSKVSQVMSWIDTAANCNVEVLDLDLNMQSNKGNMVALPSSIFRCGPLRSLLVTMEEMFKVPSFPCPNNLQSLELTYVKLDEWFFTWISNSCKCIKDLKLDSVQAENITIESSSLESFTLVDWFHLCSLKISGERLESIHIKWSFDEPGSRSLHVSAPNLKYLKWIGRLLSDQNLGDLLCLERAKLNLAAPSDSVCDFPNIFELLCSICRVKPLILSNRTIQALFREGSVAAPIFDTSYLRIKSSDYSDASIPAMVSLSRGMPSLNTLDIKCHYSYLFPNPKVLSIFPLKLDLRLPKESTSIVYWERDQVCGGRRYIKQGQGRCLCTCSGVWYDLWGTRDGIWTWPASIHALQGSSHQFA